MWALRPKPLPAEFPSQPPQPLPQVCSFSVRRPGLNQRPPLHTSLSGCIRAHIPFTHHTCLPLPPPKISLPSALACSTHHLFGLRASLSGSLILLPPSGASVTAVGTGARVHIWGLLTLPTHLYIQPGSVQLPHTDLALCSLLSPPPPPALHTQCYNCVAAATNQGLLLPRGPGLETNFLLGREGKALGFDGKGLLQMAPIKLPCQGHRWASRLWDSLFICWKKVQMRA